MYSSGKRVKALVPAPSASATTTDIAEKTPPRRMTQSASMRGGRIIEGYRTIWREFVGAPRGVYALFDAISSQ